MEKGPFTTDNGRRMRYHDIVSRMKLHRSGGIYQGLWTIDVDYDRKKDPDVMS